VHKTRHICAQADGVDQNKAKFPRWERCQQPKHQALHHLKCPIFRGTSGFDEDVLTTDNRQQRRRLYRRIIPFGGERSQACEGRDIAIRYRDIAFPEWMVPGESGALKRRRDAL
jgi:hypothetical protein